MRMLFKGQPRISILLAIVILALLPVAQAAPLKASLATMPQSAEIDSTGQLKGAFVELIRAIDELTGTPTHIVVAPFKRSVKNLISGAADYQATFLSIPKKG